MSKNEFFNEYQPATLGKPLLENLRACVVKHPAFGAALHKVLTHIELGDPRQIVLIIGASGTGKSTLSVAAHSVVAQWAEKIRGASPPAWLEAPPPHGSSYSFKPFYEELLSAIAEPLPAYKVDPEEAREHRRQKRGGRVARSTSGAGRYVKKTLREKAIPAIFVDEAQHFGRSANIDERIDAMDVIKSITELNKTKMVFFGTHAARRLQHLNGQLSRRVKVVHFMPYEKDEDGHSAFYASYASICRHVRLPIDVGREYAGFLQQNTLGAIGLLCQWLDNAAQEAISNKDTVITIDHMAEATPDEVTLDLIRKESEEYRTLQETRHRRIRKQIKKARKRRRPGRRKPTKRDTAGGAIR